VWLIAEIAVIARHRRHRRIVAHWVFWNADLIAVIGFSKSRAEALQRKTTLSLWHLRWRR
jgi:hypothetical protein